MRALVWTLAVVGLMTTSAMAHHSYAEYDRNAPVTLEGTVTRVMWSNPHVMLLLNTPSGIEYVIEWGAVSQLARSGIHTPPVGEGDSIRVIGSVNRNPEKRILTLLREIRRPADGWQWMSPAEAAARSAGTTR